MTRDEINTVAKLIKRMAVQLEQERAAHKTALAEMRSSFVARTGADEKIIEGLRVQVQDMRAEIERLRVDEREADLFRPKEIKIPPDLHLAELYQAGVVLRAEVAQLQSALNALQGKIREMAESLGKSLDERDALRAEVAALQERLRASIARGDFAQMELALLKSSTPKHPAKVGDYVKRLTGFNTTPAGEVARVTLVDADDPSQVEYEVHRPNGQKGRWSAKGCEPCDPPNHDTEAGKAAAASAVRTEPVAEEIKVGRDVRKVTT